MARPLQNGLLYFPFDIDFFQDKKIKILRGRYGSDGVMVYIYLLCEIYKNGYYIIADEDLILCLSDDLNISEASTRQIISFLLGRSLLCEIKDSTLAKPDTVLTAKSIQQRYQEAKKGLKRDIAVEAKYWLLKSDETLSFIKVRPEKSLSEKNNSKSEKNNNKSRIYDTKKRRQKESKENNMSSSLSAENQGLLTADDYNKLCTLCTAKTVDKYISKLSDWQNKNNKRCRDPFGTIKKWIEQDHNQSEQKETSYNLDDFEEYAMNFRLYGDDENN